MVQRARAGRGGSGSDRGPTRTRSRRTRAGSGLLLGPSPTILSRMPLLPFVRPGPGHATPRVGAGLRASEIVYDRAGSSFAGAAADAFDWDALLSGAGLLHLSGITPALGPKSSEAALTAARAAKRLGVLVSFDGNYRAMLWESWDSKPKAMTWSFARRSPASAMWCRSSPGQTGPTWTTRSRSSFGIVALMPDSRNSSLQRAVWINGTHSKPNPPSGR